MPNYRANVNWSTSEPMEGFFNDKDLELSKRAPMSKAFEKKRLQEEKFSWDKEVYMSIRL